jgi:hypothetical protein
MSSTHPVGVLVGAADAERMKRALEKARELATGPRQPDDSSLPKWWEHAAPHAPKDPTP